MGLQWVGEGDVTWGCSEELEKGRDERWGRERADGELGSSQRQEASRLAAEFSGHCSLMCWALWFLATAMRGAPLGGFSAEPRPESASGFCF